MMQKRSIIDISQGSKYVSTASIFNIFHFPGFLCLYTWINIWTFCFSSESVQLHCSRDVNQICNIFYWFPNNLFYIDHRNTKFLYICTIKMRKSSLWKNWRWNARLIYTIKPGQDKQSFWKIFSERNNFIYYITKMFLLCTLNYIASFNFFWFEQSIKSLIS